MGSPLSRRPAQSQPRFDRKKDAVAFESEVKRRKRLGALAELDAGEERLADFAQQWWRLHANPNLAPSTLKSYASVWDLHVLPHLGDHELRQITPEVVANLRADLDAANVGPATVRRALFVLQSVMRLAALQQPPNQALRREADARIRTGDPFITSEVLWPAELRRR